MAWDCGVQLWTKLDSRPDLHCRVTFTDMCSQVDFTRVNRIEAVYEVSRVNVNVEVRPFIYGLCIASTRLTFTRLSRTVS